MHTICNKIIGVWGLGTVGKAAVAFLANKYAQVWVYDTRTLHKEEQEYLKHYNAMVFEPHDPLSFLQQVDYVVPSPGIDIRPYQDYVHKIITELDLFYDYCTVPIIAITGSVGKTTVTSFLGNLLSAAGYRVATGGNIGIATLALLDDQNYDYIILEVSSFQLEHCVRFAPWIAIITNVYPNHLDRHGTFEHYLAAKLKIAKYQKADAHCIVPFSLFSSIKGHQLPAHLHFFGTQPINVDPYRYTTSLNLSIVTSNKAILSPLISLNDLPNSTFMENWILLCAVLQILKVKIDPSLFLNAACNRPSHRMEKVATIRDITFYNDSKSTIPESTMAAIAQLSSCPIILLLGGISKGVNRIHFIQCLPDHVRYIACFGKEAESLKEMCLPHNRPISAHATLEEAFVTTFNYAQIIGKCTVLLSPSGASYDLFANYEARGERFRTLVSEFVKKAEIQKN
jgi:UDP-N-acetylmuramoylalanine--D-glutamate ligase